MPAFPLDGQTYTELRYRQTTTADPETCLRYEMVALAHQGYVISRIARVVARSRDTVTRVLRRFREGGLDAVPRRPGPGRPRTITPEWKSELLRVIALEPRQVGVRHARWTITRLADYLSGQTGLVISQETVRLTLHAHGYLYHGHTWTRAPAPVPLENVRRENEARFRTLAESPDHVIFMLDWQQRCLSALGGWLARMDTSPAQLLGKTARDIFGEAAAIHEAANARALAGEAVEYIWSFAHATGIHYCRTQLTPIRTTDGTVVGIAGMGRVLDGQSQPDSWN